MKYSDVLTDTVMNFLLFCFMLLNAEDKMRLLCPLFWFRLTRSSDPDATADSLGLQLTFCPTSYTKRRMVSYFTRRKYVAYDILFHSIFISFCFLLERYCRHNHFVIIPQAGAPTRVGDAHCRAPARPHQVAPLPRQWNFIATWYDTSSDIQIAIDFQGVTQLWMSDHRR
jgi:hypothetical protein